MTTFLTIFQILWKAPQIFGIIKAILDVLGTSQAQNLLGMIRDALKTETTGVTGNSLPPKTEEERVRLFQRIKNRLFSNFSADDFTKKGDYPA